MRFSYQQIGLVNRGMASPGISIPAWAGTKMKLNFNYDDYAREGSDVRSDPRNNLGY